MVDEELDDDEEEDEDEAICVLTLTILGFDTSIEEGSEIADISAGVGLELQFS